MYCDACGSEAIEGMANILSQRWLKEGQHAFAFIACKGDCTNKLDPGKQMANQELGRSLLSVLANAGVDLEKTIKNACDLRTLGL
jgi:hypothetical protein